MAEEFNSLNRLKQLQEDASKAAAIVSEVEKNAGEGEPEPPTFGVVSSTATKQDASLHRRAVSLSTHSFMTTPRNA